MPFCGACGRQVGEGDRFCQECGHALPHAGRAAGTGLPRGAVVGLLALVVVLVVVFVLLNLIGGGAPLVYATEDGIYLLRSASGEPKLVVSEDEVAAAVASPNGRWIAYVTGDESRRLIICDAQGKVRKSSSGKGSYSALEWAPNSSGIAARVDSDDSEDGPSIVLFDLAKDSAPKTVVDSEERPTVFSWAPDGRQIAFVTQREELKVTDAPEGERSRTIDEDLPASWMKPVWLSSDELAYATGDQELVAYSLETSKRRSIISEERAELIVSSPWGRGAMSRRHGSAVVLGGGRAVPDGISAKLEGGSQAHYFQIKPPERTSYAVVTTGDAVQLDIVTRDGGVLARGARDEGLEMTVVTSYSESAQTVYARVQSAESGHSARYELWAMCNKAVEERRDDRSGASRADSMRGRVPGNDTYTFRGQAGRDITIDARSDDMDTLLELFVGSGTGGRRIDYDDDGGEGSNSRIRATLPESGWYTARVSSYGSRRGRSFALSVEGPGLVINPTSVEDAWPVPLRPSGLWAAMVSLDTLTGRGVSSSLVAPFVAYAASPVYRPGKDEAALVYAPLSSPDASSDDHGDVRLALLRPGQSPRPVALPGTDRGYAQSVAWVARGTALAALIVDPDSDERSLWLIPAGRPQKAKRVARDVKWFTIGGGPQYWLAEWLR